MSTAQSSDVSDAERALKDAASALEHAQSATRAAESTLRERRAEEAEAGVAYDRAAERIKDVYEDERRRLEEAARIADAALRDLEDKLQSLRPDERAPGPRPLEAVAELAPSDEEETSDETETSDDTAVAGPSPQDEASDGDDWLAQLQLESERERRAAGDL
jgi:hypothetical protein